MTHPFDQENKWCEKHGQQKVITKRQQGESTIVLLECPKCASDRLTKLPLRKLMRIRAYARLIEDAEKRGVRLPPAALIVKNLGLRIGRA